MSGEKRFTCLRCKTGSTTSRFKACDNCVAELIATRTRAGRAATAKAQDASIVCAFCHEAGNVTTRAVKVKRGVSGAKATGAVLTGGLSVVGTGLSRKQEATELRCSGCGMVSVVGR
jgi:hypothetical protein